METKIFYTLKLLLLIALFVLTGKSGYAQAKFGGRIFENHTRIPLGGIVVENLTSHEKTLSDANGIFVIGAKVSDLLLFSSPAYQNDTLYIANLNYLYVFLNLRSRSLDEVKVTQSEIKIGKLTLPPTTGPLNSHTVLYQTDAAMQNNVGGVKIMLNDSKGYQKKKLKNQQIAIDEAEKDRIAKIFSAENIQQYVPIKGQELQNFIILYIPDLKTYNSSKFNLILYLSSSYKEFCKIPVEKRQSADFLKISSK
ncbi:hypothetical protein HDF19_01990 [Mucilaginibacter sp. E4BP6]|uniref:hypothetical protein n=1 Tax=Mucilaginibacter sp. E4BP6 TaxID=2723089 RepID=UPI0015C75DC0|nr:hypothetical protein [Mucilaginibacter sp. E4BP6]NYE66638.1 hypothetical protein [Mucilaginibacter sp. E4BP6]